MLTEIQTIFLTCLLGPEDTGAFKRFRKQHKDRKYSESHREANKIRCKIWRTEFPEKSKESISAATAKNPEYYALLKTVLAREYREQANENSLAWYYRNLDSARATNNACKSKRYQRDPAYRLECACRARINKAIKGGRGAKSARTVALIGCSWTELRSHLESLFKPGMTWENYGFETWHIDHIKPIAKFDLTNPEEQRACFHWTNLQPLFASDNLKKGDNYVGS